MAHIVILGAGIGGMPCAIGMRDMLPKEHRITVVNALDYFQFVPSNPWLAVGWRKREDVVLPIAPLLERKGVGFVAKAAHGHLRADLREVHPEGAGHRAGGQARPGRARVPAAAQALSAV
jgi:NADH dehydrogenase FAD-containing subunit